MPRELMYSTLGDEFEFSGEIADQMYFDFLESYATHAIILPHAYDILEMFRAEGYRMGMITNGTTLRQWGVIHHLELEPYFDAILVSEEQGIHKPNSEIYQRALQQLGSTADSAVMIGDDPDCDVRGAKAAGLKAIWKVLPDVERPLEADCEIDCLSDLPSAIRSLTSDL